MLWLRKRNRPENSTASWNHYPARTTWAHWFSSKNRGSRNAGNLCPPLFSHGHLVAIRVSLEAPLYMSNPPPPSPASHTCSPSNCILRTDAGLESVMQSRALSDLFLTSPRGSGARFPDPLTSHPPRAGFSTQDLRRELWFLLVIFPGSGQGRRPPPSNKHIYQQKNINIIIM